MKCDYGTLKLNSSFLYDPSFDISALDMIILSDQYCLSVSAAGTHALSGLGFT